MAITDDLKQLIEAEMPGTAKVEFRPELEGATFAVHQKIPGDPARPNKPAKVIAIHFSHEAIADMAMETAAQQQQSFDAVRTFIRQKLNYFDSTNNNPKHEPPPVERWVVFADGYY
jgi:hypothetical protein